MPFFNHVTVGFGFPSSSHVRVTVLDSFVVLLLGEASMAGGSDRNGAIRCLLKCNNSGMRSYMVCIAG